MIWQKPVWQLSSAGQSACSCAAAPSIDVPSLRRMTARFARATARFPALLIRHVAVRPALLRSPASLWFELLRGFAARQFHALLQPHRLAFLPVHTSQFRQAHAVLLPISSAAVPAIRAPD